MSGNGDINALAMEISYSSPVPCDCGTTFTGTWTTQGIEPDVEQPQTCPKCGLGLPVRFPWFGLSPDRDSDHHSPVSDADSFPGRGNPESLTR